MIKRKYKYKLDFFTLQQLINWHKKNHIGFVSVISTYTQKINSEAGQFVFMRGYKDRRCFVAYTMLRNDVAGNMLPEIKETELRYFQTALGAIYLDEIRSTDIKSAYANILVNDKVISDKSFAFLCALPKPDRLAAVGMLASRNTTYTFNKKGEIIDVQKYVSPYSNVFFYAVKKTFHIMNQCKNAIGEDFLFSWVDCIYYPTEKAGNIIAECLNDYKLKFTDGILKQFECMEKEDAYKIKYFKDDKLKAFYIPKVKNRFSII
jgi:hypothetical protein